MSRFLDRSRSMIKRFAFGVAARCVGDENGRLAVKTLTGPAKGMRFRLDLAGNYEMGYFLGNYEREIVDRLSTFVKPGWVVWDVGVYIGYYTCLLARLVGGEGKVVAVEADPRNLARTRRNVEMNGLPNVTFVGAAVGAPNTEVDFVVADGSNSHISGTWIGSKQDTYAAAEIRARPIKMTSKTLDQLLIEGLAPRPDLIKLDIDGAELWAFQYSDKIGATVRPTFLVELHNPECDDAAWQFAERWNYSIEAFDKGEVFTTADSVQGTVLLRPL